MRTSLSLLAASALLAVAGCSASNDGAAADSNQGVANQTANQIQTRPDPKVQLDPEAVERARALALSHGTEEERAQARQQARTEMEGLRLVVDQSDRKLRVFRGDRLVRTHDVAVGTEENPTPIGEFAFHRVDLNPRWVPPDSEWAEDREPQPPGDPDNPMGRARLVYQMPYTIHGTDNLDSLGQAVSHGSIRLSNEHVIPLAELLLKAGGAWEGEEWFRRMTENRDEEFQIPLEQDVTLQIQE